MLSGEIEVEDVLCHGDDLFDLPVDALDKICEVLGCQPADLMEYIDEPIATE